MYARVGGNRGADVDPDGCGIDELDVRDALRIDGADVLRQRLAADVRIQRGDEEIRLTPKEYELLLLFLRNRGRALYRDYLYETVWGEDDIADSTRTLDTHITRLRRKLHLGDRLRTVRNVGYMLEKE